MVSFINCIWNLYIDGWYQNNYVRFLSNGKIQNNGIEGFYSWEYIGNELITYDELGCLCYTLQFVESANIFLSVAEHRIKNNNIILASNDLSMRCEDWLSNQIANRSFLYKSPTGEVWGRLFFGMDGKIYNYHNPNETYWRVIDNTLNIYNNYKKVTLYSEYCEEGSFGINQDLDILPMHYIDGGSIHYLESIQFQRDRQENAKKFLNIDVCFSNKSEVLLVTFNSAGSEYDGRMSKFEFYNMPYCFGTDYIRIAQSTPTRWYLDNITTINSIINMRCYRKVIFVGMSIGGYASLWFSEKLARDNPTIQYYTIVIQPQASLKSNFINELKVSFSDGYRSKSPQSNLLLEYQNLELDISSFLLDTVDNLTHFVFYDALNRSEVIQANKLKSKRVNFLAVDCNLNHGDGCRYIYDSGLVEKTIKRIIKET